MIDWLKDFEDKFSDERHNFIKSLKERKFHGSIEVHFSDGIAHAVNVKFAMRADKKVQP